MDHYQFDHGCMSQWKGPGRRRPNPRTGPELVRWFFANQGRYKQHWRSVEMARQASVPVSICLAGLHEARADGLVRLDTEGWRWIESDR